MYAPVLNNIGPALVSQGYANVADSKLAGAQALASGIASAGQSVAGGIGAALEGVQAKAAKYSQAAGQLDAMRAYGDQYGMDTSFLSGIEEKYGKDPDKLLGALSVVGSAFDRSAQMYAQDKQYTGAANLAAFKATLPGQGDAGATPKVVQAMDGIYAVNPATGSAVPVRGPGGATLQPKKAADPFGAIFGGMDGGGASAVPSPAPVPAPAAAGGGGIPVGATATNPQTGERVRWNGSAWEAL